MRIAFLTCDPFGIGGVQKVLSIIANELAKSHEVTIIHENYQGDNKVEYPYLSQIQFISGGDFFDIKGRYLCRKVIRRVNEIVIPIKNNKLLEYIYYPNKTQKGLVNLINKYSFDVVIGVGGKDSILLGLIADKVNCKVLGWEHNSYEAYFHMRRRYVWRQESLFKSVAPNLNGILVLTKKDVNEYEKNMNLKAHIMYNPLTTLTNRESECIEKKLLFIGRLVYEQKGLQLLAEVIKNVFNKDNDWTLDIVGDGEDADKLKNLIAQYGLIDRVVFHGAQKNVEKYYQNASILLVTSKWEGFGLVVTEAMEYGLPVVSFRTDGPSEIIDNNKNGILIEKYDTIAFTEEVLKLMENYEYRIQLGTEAQKRARDFYIENIMQSWNKLLQKLVKE